MSETNDAPPQGGPIVETAQGKLRGFADNGAQIFKGVRYAESTGGARRFLPPQPVNAWAGVRDALVIGPAAPQARVPQRETPFFSWYGGLKDIGEDCLFLNVFKPDSDGGKRPVLFWIHGGGWRECSGGASGFDGRDLARNQDVVVVTINHRLGGFGFLRIDDIDERFADAGNAGLLDVVAALGWVRDNIRAFGGDPGNVTIFGESGGASKIAAILSMNAAHGLFHKAIIQSSGGGLHLAEAEEAAEGAAKLARVLGMDRLSGAALQAIPMDKLIAAMTAAGYPYRGTIDGRLFHAHPFADHAPAISADIPVMAGGTNTEVTFFLYEDRSAFSLDWPTVTRRLTRMFRNDSVQTEAIVARYREVYPDQDASGIMVMIGSDFIAKRSTYRMAHLQSLQATAPVYAYLFDHEPWGGDRQLRSPHTIEIPYIFGTAEAAQAAVGDGEDVAPMTRMMQAAWGAFARTGNPNNPLLPEWKPYRAQDKQMMVLGLNSRLALDPGGAAREALEALPHFGYNHFIGDLCRD
jgi:para-nitrobenzyl esterase